VFRIASVSAAYGAAVKKSTKGCFYFGFLVSFFTVAEVLRLCIEAALGCRLPTESLIRNSHFYAVARAPIDICTDLLDGF